MVSVVVRVAVGIHMWALTSQVACCGDQGHGVFNILSGTNELPSLLEKKPGHLSCVFFSG